MKRVEAPTCKKDLQKFLGKVNYLRRFISNLSRKIDAFTPILRLKNEVKFTWGGGQNSKKHLRKLSNTCLCRQSFKHLGGVFLLNFILRWKIKLLGLF